MIMRTHLAMNVAVMLFFLPFVEQFWVFIPVFLFATLLPDVDSGFSYLGKKPLFRPLNYFVKHRGFFHSLTFAALLGFVLAFYYPVLAFPFFLGYSFHLVADSFTVEGIRPFWPLKGEVSGSLRVGGTVEDGLFLFFVVIDILMVVLYFLH